jgi:Domain of unknown function (DUF4439)
MRQARPQAQQAVRALQAALTAEHAAVYGYGVAGALLTGADRATALTDWRLHQEARDTLQEMISKLGATPVAASAAYALPFTVDDGRSARRLAAALEDGVTQAYLAVVAVTDQKLRTFGALAMLPAANRAAAWRGSTVAFPGMPAGALAAARQREHPSDRGRGTVNVVGDRDPLRPRPPEPIQPVLAATDVHVLFKGSRGRVHHVHTWHPPLRGHQPSLQPPVSQLLGKLVEVRGLCVVPLGFHRYHHRYIS